MENVKWEVKDGKLIIEAHRDNFEGYEYSSARLKIVGKGDWLYALVEVSAKLPLGVGAWPAIWMMPTNFGTGWPDSGEIDIMEHVGHDQGRIHASVHTNKYNWPNGTHKTNQIMLYDCSEAFHNYVLEKLPGVLRFYVDDTRYIAFEDEVTGWQAWPFGYSLLVSRR